MAWLRSRGYAIEKVEQWNQFSRKRYDLFSMFDGVALKSGSKILGVQACSAGTFAAHRRKLLANPLLSVWCETGEVLLIEWRKVVARGKGGKKLKVKRWEPRYEYLMPIE